MIYVSHFISVCVKYLHKQATSFCLWFFAKWFVSILDFILNKMHWHFGFSFIFDSEDQHLFPFRRLHTPQRSFTRWESIFRLCLLFKPKTVHRINNGDWQKYRISIGRWIFQRRVYIHLSDVSNTPGLKCAKSNRIYFKTKFNHNI